MEEDGDEGEEAYVVKTSSQDSMTESKTESIAASNGRWDCLCLDFLIQFVRSFVGSLIYLFVHSLNPINDIHLNPKFHNCKKKKTKTKKTHKLGHLHDSIRIVLLDRSISPYILKPPLVQAMSELITDRPTHGLKDRQLRYDDRLSRDFALDQFGNGDYSDMMTDSGFYSS